MEVVGRHALLFDDDAMAAFVNSDTALVDWHSLKIDRYDVRHLLSAPPPPRRRNRNYEPRISDDPSMDFLIDQERYLDLPSDPDQSDLKEEGEEKPSSTGGYSAVAFSYGNTDDSADQKVADAEMEDGGYLPPFSVPGDIVQTLPPTEKVHQIIARTAVFVSKHGGQSEIILRVKQGDNPTFGFLMPDHQLHAYFRYLVEHSELLHNEIDEKSQDKKNSVSTEHNDSGILGGALSMLGSLYGTGEDEEGDEGDAAAAASFHDTKTTESVETAAKDESASQKPIVSKKAKVPSVKKNTSVIGSKPKSVKGIKKEDSSGLLSTKEQKLRNHGIEATSKPIIEPPPELKRLMDKLVEFVMRNGREFEATLLEQDSKLERFPFLLSSNQYHTYYLKLLDAAQESKVNGKGIYSAQEDLGGRGTSRKASALKENDRFGDVPFEYDRKEKFKMVIGKSKKEVEEAEKESEESGFSVDAAAAAAILQAATKGIKSSGLRFISNTDTNPHSNVVGNEDGQQANLGSLQPSRPYSTAEKSDDSANLTEEQKLKAERLKRAKTFVAMLKSGALPHRTGTSRGSSAEPVEPGVFKSLAEASRASQERESSLAPTVLDKFAAKGNFSERQSKRKYRSRSIGCEGGDEEDSERDGHSIKKHASRSIGCEGGENENAVKKKRHLSHSEENKSECESCEENEDHKSPKSLPSSHHSQGKDDEDEIEDKDTVHHSERKYRPRSRRHKDDEEVGKTVGKNRKHRRRRHKSYSSSEESENEEESNGHTEHKHYKSKHPSHHSHHGDNESRSRSRRHETSSKNEKGIQKEDKYYRTKHSSHSRYEENERESTEDEMGHHRSKSSHSKRKFDDHKDSYKDEKDGQHPRKSRSSHRSPSESPRRRKKHRSSNTSHHKRDKHKHRFEEESHRRSKYDNSSDDENRHHSSSGKAGKETHDMRNELEEGEISSKVLRDELKATPVDAMVFEQRAPSLPSETTEVPADLRAKIRAMLMAARS